MPHHPYLQLYLIDYYLKCCIVEQDLRITITGRKWQRVFLIVSKRLSFCLLKLSSIHVERFSLPVILRSRQATKNLIESIHPIDSSLSLRMTKMIPFGALMDNKIAQFRFKYL